MFSRLASRGRPRPALAHSDETACPPGDVVANLAGDVHYLDAMLWRDGAIIDTARVPATLDPQLTLMPNRATTEVGLNVSDYDEETAVPKREPTARPQKREAPDSAYGRTGGRGDGRPACCLEVVSMSMSHDPDVTHTEDISDQSPKGGGGAGRPSRRRATDSQPYSRVACSSSVCCLRSSRRSGSTRTSLG